MTSLCMCVNISATVALFCLLAPKVYIVLLQPHKNVRQTSASSLAAGNKNNRTFYDPSTASTVGGQPTTHNDLNGGVYCGEIPSHPPFPFIPKERKNNCHAILTASSVVTTTVVAAEKHNHMLSEEEEAEEEIEQDVVVEDNEGDEDEEERMIEQLIVDCIDRATEGGRDIIIFSKRPRCINDYDDDTSSCDEASPVQVTQSDIT